VPIGQVQIHFKTSIMLLFQELKAKNKASKTSQETNF